MLLFPSFQPTCAPCTDLTWNGLALEHSLPVLCTDFTRHAPALAHSVRIPCIYWLEFLQMFNFQHRWRPSD